MQGGRGAGLDVRQARAHEPDDNGLRDAQGSRIFVDAFREPNQCVADAKAFSA
jgi:hypothetical protein